MQTCMRSSCPAGQARPGAGLHRSTDGVHGRCPGSQSGPQRSKGQAGPKRPLLPGFESHDTCPGGACMSPTAPSHHCRGPGLWPLSPPSPSRTLCSCSRGQLCLIVQFAHVSMIITPLKGFLCQQHAYACLHMPSGSQTWHRVYGCRQRRP